VDGKESIGDGDGDGDDVEESTDTIEFITSTERRKYRYQQRFVSPGIRKATITSRYNGIAAATRPIQSQPDMKLQDTKRYGSNGTHPTDPNHN